MCRQRFFFTWAILLPLLLINAPVWAASEVVIEIEGVKGDVAKNVAKFLSLEQQKKDPDLNDARIRRLHQRADDEITKALQPFGYYESTIVGELTQTAPHRWTARYIITLGRALTVEHLDVQLMGEGREDEPFNKLIDTLPLQQGVALDQRDYEESKQALQSLAANRGYFDATFREHKIVIDLNAYTSRVILHFDTGRRYRFGKLEVASTLLEGGRVEKYVTFQEGDPYTIEALTELQHALNDSDYFESVEVYARKESAIDHVIPVAVALVARDWQRYSLGGGYGSDTGARGKIGMNIPIVNAQGHRLDAALMVAQRRDTLSANYHIPILNPATDEIRLNSTVSLTYQEERFTVATDQGRSTLLMPGVRWLRVWAKDRINTRHGARLALDLRGASTAFVSDSDFVQGRLHSKAIRSLGQRGRVILRGTAGANFADEFRSLPTSVRFFAGGDQSVRGYRYNSLGPTNDAGDVVGGRGLLLASVEYEHYWSGNWGSALFYDAGNALDSFNEVLKKGAGIGLRWRSPVGPVRIDLAFALSDENRP
ncbi:MAG: outer membrane protein, partial [Halothiobacillaceae bacterium]